MKAFKKISFCLIVIIILIITQSKTYAETNENNLDKNGSIKTELQAIKVEDKTDTIIIYNNNSTDQKPISPSIETDLISENTEPIITNTEVEGEEDNSKTGVAYFDNIKIKVTGENITDDNILTKEGLHWSDKTHVDIIKGEERGEINDIDTFGFQNTPIKPVKAYSMNNGDKGRINFVGKTKSGINLDLLWTVKDSDNKEWKKNSGYSNNGRVKGLAFTGEQLIPNTSGNSIVTLYNEANKLSLFYQIVKHGTFEENPVLLSFISTDIDAAQGVKSDLANLVQIIPKESNLKVSDNVIYDATPRVVGLNGSVDLPHGGYLGAGFLSNFNYTFYSPAPNRRKSSYNHAVAVRYDIFGSSLQVKIDTRIKQKIDVNYLDIKGKNLKKPEVYYGYTDKVYKINVPKINNFTKIHHTINFGNKNNPIVNIYFNKVPRIIYNFIDEKGEKLKKSITRIEKVGTHLNYTPPLIKGFMKPENYNKVIEKDNVHNFIYKHAKIFNEKLAIKKNKNLSKKKHFKALPKNLDIKKNIPRMTNKSKYTVALKNNSKNFNATRVSNKPRNSSKSKKPQKYIKPQANISYQPKNIENKSISINSNYIIYKTQKSTLNTRIKHNEKENYSLSIVRKNFKENKNIFIPRKNDIDWFAINTGLKGREKKKFIEYIDNVARIARKKFNGDINKINHEVANAISYRVYHNDTLQNFVNDFVKVKVNLKSSDKFVMIINKESGQRKKSDDLFDVMHNHGDYPIDFPHLGATLSTVEKSSWYKEILKHIVGYSPTYFKGISTKDVFFN